MSLNSIIYDLTLAVLGEIKIQHSCLTTETVTELLREWPVPGVAPSDIWTLDLAVTTKIWKNGITVSLRILNF